MPPLVAQIMQNAGGAGNAAKPVTVEPVSYTHLDVYKRQPAR